MNDLFTKGSRKSNTESRLENEGTKRNVHVEPTAASQLNHLLFTRHAIPSGIKMFKFSFIEDLFRVKHIRIW